MGVEVPQEPPWERGEVGESRETVNLFQLVSRFESYRSHQFLWSSSMVEQQIVNLPVTGSRPVSTANLTKNNETMK